LKEWLVQDAQQQFFFFFLGENYHHYGNLHLVKKLRQSVEIWYSTSEYSRQEMNPNFRIIAYNLVYIMSFWGAKGNVSKVHQLIGVRGLV